MLLTRIDIGRAIFAIPFRIGGSLATLLDSETAPGSVIGFDQLHPVDRTAVLISVCLIWFGLLSDFLPNMSGDFASPTAKAYELIKHLHAALSVGWMVLLSWQMMRVRAGNMAGHRATGRRYGPLLATALVVTAIGTKWAADRKQLALNPAWPTQCMASQLGHLIPFAVLTATALRQTRRPGAHKRLLIMATAAVLDTGLTHWLGTSITDILGDGPLGQTLSRFPVTWGMLGLMLAYDLATRRRLHPQFVPAAALILGTEAVSIKLHFHPW